jgi:subtilisin family serine protease
VRQLADRLIRTTVSWCFVLAAGPAAAHVGGAAAAQISAEASGQILVKFKTSQAAQRATVRVQAQAQTARPERLERVFRVAPTARAIALSQAQAKRVRPGWAQRAQELRDGFARTYRVSFDAGVNVEDMLQRYRRDPDVEYAEPVRVYRTHMRPDDPYYHSSGTWGQAYGDLWGLHKAGGEAAWDLSQGEGVVVAVIDTGIDETHPDIAANIWRNPREIPGNGRDDDGNGYVDDVIGWDFTDGDNRPDDTFGHGTHVAGTIAAVGNNRIGVVGVAPKARILTAKGLTAGGGFDTVLAGAVRYAADSGADVLNVSWGGAAASPLLQEAFHYAHAVGSVVVASAGNENADTWGYFPASLPNVIAVAATNPSDEKAEFSNWGMRVDLAAPGVDVLSLRAAGSTMGPIVGDRYMRASGTSMACPHVAGLAALILARHPEYDSAQVRDLMKSTATPSQSPVPLGTGRIDAQRAVTATALPLLARLALPPVIGGTFDVIGSAAGAEFVSYNLSYAHRSSPGSWMTVHTQHTSVDSGILVSSFDSWSLPTGEYVFRLQVVGTRQTLDTYVQVSVQQVKIASPLERDVRRAGDVLEIRGVVGGRYDALTLEYVTAGTHPSSAGITLTGASDGLLARWDTGGLPGGVYDLVLTARERDRRHSDTLRGIFLHPKLKKGWPQYLSFRDVVFPENDRLEPLVVDLDGDGRREVLAVNPSFRDRSVLTVQDAAGNLRWSRSLRAANAGAALVAGQLDADAGLEILVKVDDMLYAFDPDGAPCAGPWPLTLPGEDPTLIVADLDRDGRNEIVVRHDAVYGHPSPTIDPLYVLDNRGRILTRREPVVCEVPYLSVSGMGKVAPAVGNLDADADLEIVTRDGCLGIVAYNLDGSDVAGWRRNVGSYVAGALVTADLDQDGYDEVLVPTYGRGLQILDRHGLQSSSAVVTAMLGSPAVADVTGDGVPEIAYIQSFQGRVDLRVVDRRGNDLPGWPQPLATAYDRAVARASVGLADVNGDGRIDVAAMGTVAAGMSRLFAWDHLGTPIDLGAGAPALLPEPYASGASPILTDVDGDGRLDWVTSSLFNATSCPYAFCPPTKMRHSLYVWELDAPHNPAKAPWPMFQKDAQRTGRYFKNATPIGWLDVVDASGIARGWARDPNTPDAVIDVHFYVDGPAGVGAFAGAATANTAHPDGNIGLHGFTFSIPRRFRDGRPHTLYVHGIDSSRDPMANVLLQGVPKTFVVRNQPPIGYLDGIQPDGTAFGWTLDADTPAQALAVHFYVDCERACRFAGTAVADVPRPDLNQPPIQATGNHGFRFWIPASLRDGQPHTLYAFGIDSWGDGAPNTLLTQSPRTFTLTNQRPIGYLDAISPAGVASGWTADRDTPAQALTVHVYADCDRGPCRYAGATTADRPRPDLNQPPLSLPGPHGFQFTIPAFLRDGQPHTLYVFGLDSWSDPALSARLEPPKAFTLQP